MGLGMYLYAEIDLCGWDFEPPEEQLRYANVLAALGITEPICPNSPHGSLRVTVAYWRKANAVHAWFVEKVQGGVDECQRSEVSRDQLLALVADCKAVIESVTMVPARIHASTIYGPGDAVERVFVDGGAVADPSVAIEKLPTQSGFFFGSTNYDEHYVADLKRTVEQIERALSLPAFEKAQFSYRAS